MISALKGKLCPFQRTAAGIVWSACFLEQIPTYPIVRDFEIYLLTAHSPSTLLRIVRGAEGKAEFFSFSFLLRGQKEKN
jgi:hypothetical protein